MRIGEYEITVAKYPELDTIPIWRVEDIRFIRYGNQAILIKESDPLNRDCRTQITELYYEKMINLTHPGNKPEIGDRVQFPHDHTPRPVPDDQVQELFNKLK